MARAEIVFSGAQMGEVMDEIAFMRMSADALREIRLTMVAPDTAEVREALLAAYSAGWHDARAQANIESPGEME